MREIPADLAAHLAQDATTLCRCWRVTRRDGAVLGFTEHDRDLNVDGTLFAAASGFQSSDAEAALGLSAPNGEVAGAFSSDAIGDADLRNGLYDGARVEVFVVNWAAPSQYLLEHVREIGNVKRTADHFQAELRGLAARLDQPAGRVYGRRCDATLGDTRCGVDLASSALRANGTIIKAGTTQAMVSGLAGFAAGFFTFGSLTFLDGALAGRKVDIGAQDAGDPARLSFWLPLQDAPQPGDRFSITAGCDKSFGTCRNKFANGANFQGFPHMPGADFAYSYASGSVTHDGGPLYT